jgi:hypothetical protein
MAVATPPLAVNTTHRGPDEEAKSGNERNARLDGHALIIRESNDRLPRLSDRSPAETNSSRTSR